MTCRPARRGLLILTILLVGFAGCYKGFLLLEYLDGPPPTLSVHPAGTTITTLVDITQFSVTGGTPPYEYSAIPGYGTIDVATGEYIPSSGGTDTIRVFDQNGDWGETTVTVKETGQTGIWISPIVVSLNDGETITFQAGGGTAPYTFSVFIGDGSTGPPFPIDSATGEYTAVLELKGVAIVRVEDSTPGTPAFVDAAVQIRNPANPMSVTPSPAVLYQGESVQFNATESAYPIYWSPFGVGPPPLPTTPGIDHIVTFIPNNSGTGFLWAYENGGTNEAYVPFVVLEAP